MKVIDKTNIRSINNWEEHILEGIAMLIYKEKNWTSFDVVKKLRWLLKKKCNLKKLKVGHAGTLDPLAEGLLILCAGRSTKRIHEFQNLPKVYRAVMKIGATTASYDREKQEENRKEIHHISEEDIYTTAQQFIGQIEQVPPIYSAIKQGGVKLYQKARAGELVDIKSRTVSIERIVINQVSLPLVDFTLFCSKGTYVRSLTFDWGRALGVGGYLYELTREAIGSYQVQRAMKVAEWEEILS